MHQLEAADRCIARAAEDPNALAHDLAASLAPDDIAAMPDRMRMMQPYFMTARASGSVTLECLMHSTVATIDFSLGPRELQIARLDVLSRELRDAMLAGDRMLTRRIVLRAKPPFASHRMPATG